MKLSLTDIKRDAGLSPRIEQGTVAEIAKQYAECFDQLPPIVVFQIPGERKFLLVDGWHRYRAAELLGLSEIAVDKKAGSAEEATEYALLANLKHGLPLTRKERRHVIAEFLKLYPERSNNWIAEDLGVRDKTVEDVRKELESKEQLVIYEMLMTKDGREYPRTIKQPKDIGDVEDEAPDELPEKRKSLGSLWLNEAHNMDSVAGLKELPAKSLDLVFADPPYNLGKRYGEQSIDSLPTEKYFSWCMQWFVEVHRTLKEGGAFYVMHYPEVAARWKQQLDSLLTFQRWISWVYPSNIGHSGNNWRRSHRTILYYAKGEPVHFDGEADAQPYKNPDDPRVKHLGKEGTTPYDWWELDLVKNVSHEKTEWANQLPEPLMRRIILTSCPTGGVACDPFIGSGTTAVVAEETGRDWIGFDIESEACRITRERVDQRPNSQ